MKPSEEEFKLIKQELLILQKRIELVEEQARLQDLKKLKNEDKTWVYTKYVPKKYTETDGDTVKINFNTDLDRNKYYSDNMNRSSTYEFN